MKNALTFTHSFDSETREECMTTGSFILFLRVRNIDTAIVSLSDTAPG